jgi:hypothetical protein
MPPFTWLPRTQTTRACRPAGLPDLAAYFVIVAVLLIPDARSLSLGSLKFERLSSQVDQVAKDVGTLLSLAVSQSQSQSQKVVLHESLVEQAREGFISDKAFIDTARGLLPHDADTTSQLDHLDELARRLATATWQEVNYGVFVSQTLLGKVRAVSEAAVLSSGTSGDTVEARDQAEPADDVLREFIEGQG